MPVAVNWMSLSFAIEGFVGTSEIDTRYFLVVTDDVSMDPLPHPMGIVPMSARSIIVWIVLSNMVTYLLSLPVTAKKNR